MSNHTATYDRTLIDFMIERGDAKAIKHPEGTAYLLDFGDVGRIVVYPSQITEAAKNIESTADFIARKKRAWELVEQVFTLRHGPAEVRDGEFSREEQEMADKIMDLHHDGEYEHALSEEVWDAKYHAERNARLSDARIEFPAGSYSGGL